MKKVFCISCHRNTNPLIFLVEYLSSFEENTILIHVDLKSDLSDFKNLERDNVRFIEERVSVSWGSVSQIELTINLLFQANKLNYDYLFFLSGDDLPCKSNNDLNKFICSIDSHNLIDFQDERSRYVDPKDRVKYNYPNIIRKRNKDIFDKIFKKLFFSYKFLFVNFSYIKHRKKIDKFYKGTNWFGLNSSTVSSIISFLGENSWYLNMYRNSFCADEVFFHTLIRHLNIEGNFHNINYMNDALRYIDWVSGPDYPKILNDSDDILKIKMSHCLFARKFPSDISKDVFKELIK